ncbi:FERRIC REDUCTION OXIDASE 2 [Salix koriyanagi]|uniref:FERRIC REDUCTION OXIDASE 2 n=1 Tax=Salix koriyanagi TaxID=2511006 RepID=A0A9Q0U401_9ROSI|nr:FERRIC REDUCTION OXIDASE 2 [Salix koriyanagi]
MILGGVRLLLMIVLLGYAMVWIVMPTKTFKKIWLPSMREKLNSSTYFGKQGTAFLVFMFPVLFVAVVGCVYLHFRKRSGDNKLESNGEKESPGHVEKADASEGPSGNCFWHRTSFLDHVLGPVNLVILGLFS